MYCMNAKTITQDQDICTTEEAKMISLITRNAHWEGDDMHLDVRDTRIEAGKEGEREARLVTERCQCC